MTFGKLDHVTEYYYSPSPIEHKCISSSCLVIRKIFKVIPGSIGVLSVKA